MTRTAFAIVALTLTAGLAEAGGDEAVAGAVPAAAGPVGEQDDAGRVLGQPEIAFEGDAAGGNVDGRLAIRRDLGAVHSGIPATWAGGVLRCRNDAGGAVRGSSRLPTRDILADLISFF